MKADVMMETDAGKVYGLEGCEVFAARAALKKHLGRACFEGLKQKQFETVITDAFAGGKLLSRGMALAVGIVLARWMRKHISEKRVGIVLPPSLGGMLANLACVLCDKTPVNLNFTMGRDANASAIRQAEIKTIITAAAVIPKIPDFPWTASRVDLAVLLKSFSKLEFLFWRLMVALLPTSVLASWLSVPKIGDNAEAALLFTSGSSGDPKGVVLSHRNILANVSQVAAVLPKDKINRILGCLPIFHSFGFTVTLWWPLICGPPVVTYISPLEVKHLAEIIQRFKIALLVTTPTFLRSFLKRAHREELQSLQMVVTGAEKLPVSLLETFEKKFEIPVCEGYGMTETSPVISVNLPDFENTGGTFKKVGTVGRLLPGVAVRVTNPETGEAQALDKTGLLWFRGANVFSGYLNDSARNAEVLKDGWYSSGDVGHLDADGFLTIDGRISRFSKIGGEMVPHGTVEQKLEEICKAMEPGQEHIHAVVIGVSEAAKGEFLVALVTSSVDPMALRKRLADSGLPHLWIPKIIKRVETIPTLASGKLDLKQCQLLAERAAA